MNIEYLPKEDCFSLTIFNNSYILDKEQLPKIINMNKKWKIRCSDSYPYPYPFYESNKKDVDFLQVLYGFKSSNLKYIFKNNDKNDLRSTNVSIQHNAHDYINNLYNILHFIPGHITKNGKDAYIMKNPLWIVTDKNTTNKTNTTKTIIMYCENNIFVKLCEKSYQKILDFEKSHNDNKKITFFICANNYICSSNNIYIHQIIMDCFGNGKGTNTISVDHIDRDPLNNRMENLRLATHKEQQENSKGVIKGTKRTRKTNARPLPEGITQDMLRKYVIYYKECYNKEKELYREFFRVEKHPKLEKQWTTTKSGKISILDKLKLANDVVDNLEKDVYP